MSECEHEWDTEVKYDHRLVCGDSTKAEDYDKLFAGQPPAKLIFTSPPYNMNANLYKEYKDNKQSQEYIDFNLNVIQNCERYTKGFLFWNISYNKNSRSEWIKIFGEILMKTGFKFLEHIIWDKGHGMPITSPSMLTRRYEMILATENEDTENRELDYNYVGANGTVTFNKRTNRNLTNYWYITTFKSQTDTNKACFPVALPTKAIVVMTLPGDVVLDPFMGSGTTLIAGEKSDRKVYGMEMEPGQCDVAIQRFKNYSNKSIYKNGQKV
jgi:DNA modification methylase